MEATTKITLPLCIELTIQRYGKAIRDDTNELQRVLYQDFDMVCTEWELREALGLTIPEETEARLIYEQVC